MPLLRGLKPVWNMSERASIAPCVTDACNELAYKRTEFFPAISRVAGQNSGDTREEYAAVSSGNGFDEGP